MRFLTLDFETSGTDPNDHAPVTLGVAAFEDGIVTAQDEWLCRPPTHYKEKDKITRAYDERARLIHGYTLEHLLEYGKPMAMVCIGFAEFVAKHSLGNVPVVAYNAAFDMAFLNTLLFLGGEYDRGTSTYRRFPTPISGPWQCAMQLAERWYPRLENYKLQTVAPFLGVGSQGEVHGAMSDAILAGLVFAKIRDQREKVA